MKYETKLWLKDTFERAGFTFVEAFLGLLIVGKADLVAGLDLATIETAAISGLIAALAVVKAAVASRREALSPASFAQF